MARLIRLIDLAHAVAHAGLAPVRDGAVVTGIDLDLRVLCPRPPTDAGVWGMRVRYPDPPRFGFFAGWRRARRRRAGIDVARLTLRWTPPHLDAVIDGERVARLEFTMSGSGGSSDGHPRQTR